MPEHTSGDRHAARRIDEEFGQAAIVDPQYRLTALIARKSVSDRHGRRPLRLARLAQEIDEAVHGHTRRQRQSNHQPEPADVEETCLKVTDEDQPRSSFQ